VTNSAEIAACVQVLTFRNHETRVSLCGPNQMSGAQNLSKSRIRRKVKAS